MKCAQCGNDNASIMWKSMVICRDCAQDLILYLLQEIKDKIEKVEKVLDCKVITLL